jgi:hypothetical protein
MTYRWAREPWDTKLPGNKCIIGSLFMKLVTVVEESTQIKWSRGSPCGEWQVSRVTGEAAGFVRAEHFIVTH